MSLPAVMRETELIGQHLFDHTPFVRAEIERFLERFERNERHREFDGILRASHALIEAAETPVEALFNTGKMEALTSDIDKLSARLQKLAQPTYAKEHADYLADVLIRQKEKLDVCRAEAHLKLRSS